MGRILQLLGILAGPVHADPNRVIAAVSKRCFTNAAHV